MKKSGGPVLNFPLPEAAAKEFAAAQAKLPLPDFSDTEETFRHLSNGELKRASRLFKLMGQDWLTNIMSSIGVSAVQLGLPGAAWGVRNTIYHQFVGGTSLLGALPMIERLYERQVTSILDFGAEAKNSEEDFNNLMKEVLRAVEFSAEAPAASASVVKISGLAPDAMLEDLNGEEVDFNDETHAQFQAVIRRLDAICSKAEKLGVQIYIDAEESWMQNTIDQLATKMMARYNKDKMIVLNTFQMYRHDRLDYLIRSHEKARKEGYYLGAKLVRGAYIVKENRRAAEMGYPTPIQPSIEATHADFNTALSFCIDNVNTIGFCIGSHNEASNLIATELLKKGGIPRNHPHVIFAQLLGMSDNLTFNLAAGGYNVSKYMVYGPVKEVLPYLVRRAQENASVTGEMGRELNMIQDEMNRRG
ncbi:MAG: proline dehydrogenase [Neolewinella sp.]|jgi:proline dehydrogenase